MKDNSQDAQGLAYFYFQDRKDKVYSIDLGSKYKYKFIPENNTLYVEDNSQYLANFYNIDNSKKIDNVSLLVGKNGSGKTTILKCIFNLLTEDFLKDIESYVCVFKTKSTYLIQYYCANQNKIIIKKNVSDFYYRKIEHAPYQKYIGGINFSHTKVVYFTNTLEIKDFYKEQDFSVGNFINETIRGIQENVFENISYYRKHTSLELSKEILDSEFECAELNDLKKKIEELFKELDYTYYRDTDSFDVFKKVNSIDSLKETTFLNFEGILIGWINLKLSDSRINKKTIINKIRKSLYDYTLFSSKMYSDGLSMSSFDNHYNIIDAKLKIKLLEYIDFPELFDIDFEVKIEIDRLKILKSLIENENIFINEIEKDIIQKFITNYIAINSVYIEINIESIRKEELIANRFEFFYSKAKNYRIDQITISKKLTYDCLAVCLDNLAQFMPMDHNRSFFFINAFNFLKDDLAIESLDVDQYKLTLLDNSYDFFDFSEFISFVKMNEGRIRTEDDLLIITDKILFISLLRIDQKKHLKLINNYSSYSFSRLSSGQIALFNLFSKIFSILDSGKDFNVGENSIEKVNNIVLLIDEVDLYLHPEWQKQIISKLIKFCSRVFFEKKVQIIMTTNNAIPVSDVLTYNVVLLGQDKKQHFDNYRNTFGGNIFNLLNDTFFIQDGFIGEFAQMKIQELIDMLYEKDIMYLVEHMDEIEKRINLIGEDLIKNKLLEILEQRLSANLLSIKSTLNRLEDRISTLEKRKNE